MSKYHLCFAECTNKFYIYNAQLQLSQTSVIEALPVQSDALFDYHITLQSNIKEEITTSSITVLTSSSFHFDKNDNLHRYTYDFLQNTNMLSKLGHILIDCTNTTNTLYDTLEKQFTQQMKKINAYIQCIQSSNDQIARLYSRIESLQSISMPHWFICKFKTDWWLSFLKGGNKHRKLSVSCVIPRSMFNDYIYIHNGKEFDGEILHFAGGQERLSTKYSGGSCPYGFVTYFFNDSQRIKSISTRTPQQYVNVYNCNFSYSNKNNKLTFTSDVTWKYTLNESDGAAISTVWQKLCDTT